MDVQYHDVVQRLREERLRCNLSQEKISSLLNMTQSHYSKLELGNGRFSYRELKNLCQTDIDMHYVFTGQKAEGSLYDEWKREHNVKEQKYILSILTSMIIYGDKEVRTHFQSEQLEYIRYIVSMENSGNTIFQLLRDYTGYTQLNMAAVFGVDIKKYRGLEKGNKLPDSEILMKLYNNFGIGPLIILDDERGFGFLICDILQNLEEEFRSRIVKILKAAHNILEEK